MDPACGSGTFLFHAVRHHLRAADAAGLPPARALVEVTRRVIGVDVHPVAVTLARVTYLLAVGRARLGAEDRPPITVPVYLGDSVQWGQEADLLSAGALVVPTETQAPGDQGTLAFPAGSSLGPGAELRFPDRLLADAGRFDELVAQLSTLATDRPRGARVPDLAGVLRAFAVHADDEAVLVETFRTMCRLHDEDRNHIWGYYVRNLARPLWLSQPEHRVDALVGNPPWLAYRYMTAAQQAAFKEMSAARGLWNGRGVATHQDLSGLFLARAVELYLRDGGRFGLVLPLAALSRQQFRGLRTGDLSLRGAGQVTEQVHVAYGTPWDLHQLKPSFFPVPGCVVHGTRTPDGPVPLTASAETWSGRLPAANLDAPAARPHLARTTPQAREQPTGAVSPYAARFAAGATVFPRVLVVVEPQPDARRSALGVGAGRTAVRSQRVAREKPPWKDLDGLTGAVENQFLRPLLVGDSVLPHRLRPAALAVVPWDGQRLLSGADPELDRYPGLATWWRKAERAWEDKRASDRMTLLQRVDFRRGMTQQFPAAPHRVVYTASGMYLAAARVEDPRAVVEHKLYWAAAANVEEARYLTAVLNSPLLTRLVRPLQARGEHNPRDFDKYVFRLAIPLYDPQVPAHRDLADLAAQAETLVAGLALPEQGTSFQTLRSRARAALAADAVGAAIERAVAGLGLEVYASDGVEMASPPAGPPVAIGPR